MKRLGTTTGIPVGCTAGIIAALLSVSFAEPALAKAAPRQAGATSRAAAFNPLSVDASKTRIFLPLKNVRIKKREARVTSWQMELTSDTPGTYALERSVPHSVLRSLRIQIFENKTYLRADWRYAAPVNVRVAPNGIEIVFHHRQVAPQFRTVASGVRYWEAQRWTSGGPVRLRVLRIDPKQARLLPVVAHGDSGRLGLRTVSAIAKGHGAIAAINAGFFSPRTGEPQGALVLNHTPVSRTMLNRPSLVLTADGHASIKVEKPVAFLRMEDGSGLKIQAINEAARRNRLTLYTPHYGGSTHTFKDPSRWEVAIASDGQVVGEGNGSLAIPQGGYVVSGQGSAAIALRHGVGYGQSVKVAFSLNRQIAHAVGGGPTLLQNNQVTILANQQRFQADVAAGRTSRTAVGLTRDGKYILLVADGRRPGYSVGLTLREVASTLKELGAVEAMNLDGGGSTTMWLRGQTVNRPSDGRERAVSTALLVLPKDRQVASVLSNMLAAGGF